MHVVVEHRLHLRDQLLAPALVELGLLLGVQRVVGGVAVAGVAVLGAGHPAGLLRERRIRVGVDAPAAEADVEVAGHHVVVGLVGRLELGVQPDADRAEPARQVVGDLPVGRRVGGRDEPQHEWLAVGADALAVGTRFVPGRVEQRLGLRGVVAALLRCCRGERPVRVDRRDDPVRGLGVALLDLVDDRGHVDGVGNAWRTLTSRSALLPSPRGLPVVPSGLDQLSSSSV